MADTAGIRLEFSGRRLACASLAEVNAALAQVGSWAWPLDLRSAPADFRAKSSSGENEALEAQLYEQIGRLKTLRQSGVNRHVWAV